MKREGTMESLVKMMNKQKQHAFGNEFIRFLLNLEHHPESVFQHRDHQEERIDDAALFTGDELPALKGRGVVLSSSILKDAGSGRLPVKVRPEDLRAIMELIVQLQKLHEDHNRPFDEAAHYRMIAGSLLWIEERRGLGFKWQPEDVIRLVAVDLLCHFRRDESLAAGESARV